MGNSIRSAERVWRREALRFLAFENSIKKSFLRRPGPSHFLSGGTGGKEVRIFALLSRREKALQLTKNLLTKSSTKRFREYIKRKKNF